MKLLEPSAEQLAGYVDALRRGWYPNTTRPQSGTEELQAIARDAGAFLATQRDDPLALGPAVTLADGTRVARLPGRRRWIWAGSTFCGQINLRWAPDGRPELPAHVLGHIGYSLVPWQHGRGLATQALALMLPLARAEGLPWVELTTDLGNHASRRVIEKNGGWLLETFDKPSTNGAGVALRFRIDLIARSPSVDTVVR